MTAIRYWVEQALEANRLSHSKNPQDQVGAQTGPFLSARALAMTMLAMHEAYAGQPSFNVIPSPGEDPAFIPGVPGQGKPSDAHAAAAAAYTMLSDLYADPSQTGRSLRPELSTAWEQYSALHQPPVESIEHGHAVAKAVFAWREADKPYRAGIFLPTGKPYDHDEAPREPGQGFAGPLWGGAPAFAVTRQDFAEPFGAGPGNTFSATDEYAEEYDEVRRKGQRRSADRTPEETLIGIFWAYDGPNLLGTPPRLYMQVALAVLDRYLPGDEAGSLAILTRVAVAMADAGIQAWHYKYSQPHMVWRPALGIPRANHPTTPADPEWTPLGRPDTNGTGQEQTPNFPAYPSGHATFGAAAFQVLRHALKEFDPSGVHDPATDEDGLAFTFTSDEFNGINLDPGTRRPRPRVPVAYPSLWKAIVDNSESRIWLGVHWRMDGISKIVDGETKPGQPETPAELGAVGGVRLGMDIANALNAAAA